MAKTFSERERKIIRAKLIAACKECWNRYGYQKTNVRELASMANISTGAFYQFYESKELLFMDAGASYEKELHADLDRFMKKTPGKQGLASATKHLCDKLSKMRWFMALWEEWPVIVRKLPPDYMEKDFLHDMGRMKEVIQKYDLKPALEIGKLTQIFELLAISIIQRHLLPGDYTEASNFIIDCVVNAMFL